MSNENMQASVLLAAMPEGIGDLTYASAEWVAAADEAMSAVAAEKAAGLSEIDSFTLCVVAHNAPAYLHSGSVLAWHARFNGSSVSIFPEALPTEECSYKIEGDHSILSNLARIQYHGKDPAMVMTAKDRLGKLSKWVSHGGMPEHQVLTSVLHSFHDAMAPRTMPRFVFMTPEWVNSTRYILSTRATSEKYAHGIRDLVYTFSEEFTDTPHYGFPDGSHGGFWAHFDHGRVTVGAGPLPGELEPADKLTKGVYTPIVPVGRTVNVVMTEEEQEESAEYNQTAFRFDKEKMCRPVTKSSPSGKGDEMPVELARIFMPLHDELSKRTSGELPSDYDPAIKEAWAKPLKFDRDPDYDVSWVRYDQFDIYGNPVK